MAINEIEINKSSITFKCWGSIVDDLADVFKKITADGDQFEIEDELPGFHDYDIENDLIRGFYSGIVPFEVEQLVDGIMTKTLHKKLESCEFFLNERGLFTTGKPGATSGLVQALCSITGYSIPAQSFEFEQLSLLQERMTLVKGIVVRNPKEKEIRTARLSGYIESYTEYNIIDPRNHSIDSVAGLVDSPMGPIKIMVGKGGTLRLSVRKGLIILVEQLEWILDLVISEKRPAPVDAPQSVF